MQPTAPTVAGRFAQGVFQPLDVFALNVFDAIAEARAQKAMIEV